MAKSENPFKRMMGASQGTPAKKEDAPQVEEVQSASEGEPTEEVPTHPEPFIAAREKTLSGIGAEPAAAAAKRGRGRPATGKRSDPGWIGRTFYVKESNDIQVEVELALLRTQGIEMDKSALVDSLLAAWVAYRNGGNTDSLLGEISPRRKD